MLKKIKKAFRGMIYGHVASSEKYIEYLRQSGVSVGENVVIYSPETVTLDASAPCLLSIGNNVIFARGVTVLTHDYSWCVLRRLSEEEGAIFGAQSAVNIGNNVFVGINAIITRGVTVGDNVVIGAGSVVTRDCEPNSVYAGNPAKKIMTIEEYLQKRSSKQFAEAKALANEYKNKYGEKPPIEVFKEYFMLFLNADEVEKYLIFKKQLGVGDYDKSIQYMKDHKPMFDGYEAFLDECFKTN